MVAVLEIFGGTVALLMLVFFSGVLEGKTFSHSIFRTDADKFYKPSNFTNPYLTLKIITPVPPKMSIAS